VKKGLQERENVFGEREIVEGNERAYKPGR